MSNLTSSVAAYLYTLTNVSWTKEVRSTTLSKEFMTQHGLTGSPKLSKQLLSLGLSHQQISNLLQLTAAKGGYKLWENGESPEVVVRLQGNSTHFSSCQRVTNPYDPGCWEGVDRTNCKILSDKEAYEEGILSFITIGNPITEDNKGWVARAKLRHVINKQGETIAYYLDRFYGDGKKIEEAAMDIAAQKGVDLIGSTSHYSGKFAKEYVNCNIPSRRLGYQDSLNTYGSEVYAVKLQSQSIILTAYRSREKDGGVYRTPVTKGVFNPQTNKMIESEVKPSRTIERALLKAFPNTDISVYSGGVTKSGSHLKLRVEDNCIHYISLWRKCVSYIEVEYSDIQKGYGKAIALPYYYNNKTNTLTVSVDKDVKRPSLCYAAHEVVGISGTKPCRNFDVWDSMVGGWAEACSIYEIDFDTSEYDRNGYDREGYDHEGYNREGYNEQGYDREGYNRYGYNYFGYDRKGYNREGYDQYGFDSNGYDRYGRTL